MGAVALTIRESERPPPLPSPGVPGEGGPPSFRRPFSFPSSARRGSGPCRSSCGRRPRRRAPAGRSRSSSARRSATLKASVSCESIDVPEYQPLIERRPIEQRAAARPASTRRRPRTSSVPFDGQAADGGGHRVAAGRRGEDDLRAAELRAVPPRGPAPGCRCSATAPELAGERLLVLARGRCATVRKPIFAAYCTPRWPSPPRPSTATRSPARAPLLRSALNVVSAGAHQRRRVDGAAGRRASAPAPLAGATMYSA